MFLPRNEIAALTMEDLRLLFKAAEAADAGTVHSVFHEGAIAQVAEWLCENSYLELVDMDGVNGFSYYQATEKGKQAAVDCLNFLDLV